MDNIEEKMGDEGELSTVGEQNDEGGVSREVPLAAITSDSSSSESDEEEPPPKRRCRRNHRSRSRDSSRDMNSKFELLSQQLVSHLNSILWSNYTTGQASTPVLNNNPLANINTGSDDPFSKPTAHEKNIVELDVSVKEPIVPKADPNRLAKLVSLQRFDSSEWNSVRYAEIQKKYIASPGFIDLRINEELRFLEDFFAPYKWFQMERSFAALSNAFLTQNEIMNLALNNIIDWIKQPNSQLNSTSVYEKLKELFGSESNYKSVSHDVLQLICGKRAEIIEMRRKLLIKGLKGKHIREDIEKIPPSAEFMFNPQSLATYLQKIGGITKLEKNYSTRSKPARLSKFPARSRSPVASTSREKPFRDSQYKPKQVKNRKRNFDEHDKKKKGGRKSQLNKNRHG